jgi:nitrite reductase/ring-hydroxylating ferredoxin subunit
MSSIVRLCKADAVSPGKVKQIEVVGADEPLALFNVNGTYYLTDDTCTHGFASLSQGDVDGGVIHCPLHGGAFWIATGKPAERPCTINLKTYRVWRDGDDIVSDLGAGPVESGKP